MDTIVEEKPNLDEDDLKEQALLSNLLINKYQEEVTDRNSHAGNSMLDDSQHRNNDSFRKNRLLTVTDMEDPTYQFNYDTQ